jgi:hypothetical protein
MTGKVRKRTTVTGSIRVKSGKSNARNDEHAGHPASHQDPRISIEGLRSANNRRGNSQLVDA